MEYIKETLRSAYKQITLPPINKVCCKLLIQRYLGVWLDKKLSIDQLSVELANGCLSLKELNINTRAVNDRLNECGIPLIVMDGYIGKIRVEIPWLSLLSESASICVEDFQLVVKGSQTMDMNNLESVASMIGSVLMRENDLNMADCVFEEISKRNNFSSVFLSNDNTAETLLGFINVVQSKFRLTIKNLTLRFENVPSEGATIATAVEVHIQNVSFEDIDKTSNSMFNLNKEFKLSGVSVHTDVLSSIKTGETTFSKTHKEPTSLFVKKDSADQKSETCPMQSLVQSESDIFYSCYENRDQLETTLSGFKLPSAPIKCAELVGDVSVVFKTKNESKDGVNRSQIEAEVGIGAAHIFATASQLEIIKRCFCALLSTKKEAHAEDKNPISEEGYEIILNMLERKTTQENVFPEECQSVENSFCEFKNTRMHENVKKEFRMGIKIGTFMIFIPHFDYLASNNADQQGGFAQSLESLGMKSECFFTSIQKCSIASKRGISEFQDHFYPEDHLRMVGNSIKITSSFGNGEEFLCETVAEQLSVLEYLTPESVPGQSAPLKVNIFKFSQEESIENTPNFKMILKKALGKGNAEVNVLLGPVRTEVDFSIADRLSNLIICKPFFDAASNGDYGTKEFVEVSHLISNIGADIEREQQPETVVNVKCSKWRVDLRIPNNTSKKDANFSHTQRNVHDELFHFGFKEVDISIPIRTEVSAVHILSTAIYGDFFGKELKISKDQHRIFYAVGNESTKLDMKLMFKKKEYVIDRMTQQPGSSGIYQNINSSLSENFSNDYPQREGPFSKTSRSYCSGEETKEIVQAGTRKEIHEFQRKCEIFASTHLLINIPTLKLHIPAKDLLELLYNRVVNDLATFKLSVPCSAMQSNPTKTFAYYEARDSSNFENANQSTVKTLRGSHFNREALHSFVMTLNVEKTAVVCNTSEASQVALDLEKVHIGTTSGYHGDKDHTFFHFTSTEIAAGFSENSRIPNVLSSKSFGKWSNESSQLETVSSSDELSSGSTEDAISIALHIQSKPARNERDIVVGTAVRNTHLLAKPIKNFDEFWISQLADLFTLQDYTDDELPAISTDVHVCFDNVIIGYDHSWINSESKLKLRAVLGNCFVATSIGPNIEILKAMCVLQNCQLLMKDEKESVQIERYNKAKTCSKKFVNVATLGSVQLDVSLGLGDSRTHPKFEIRCQNDVLSAWVCADSLATLTNTLVEYIEHVELNSKMEPIENVETKSNIGESTWSYASTRSRRTQKMNAASELPDHVQQRLETMIEEAVNYNDISDHTVVSEKFRTTTLEAMKNRNATSHGGVTDDLESTVDDFCFVQHTELRRSTAFNPEESSVREFLSGSSLKTNFFDCTNESDDSAANDKSALIPIFKYFVKDVTVRLCLYAGNDLSEAPSPIKSYITKEFQNGCGPGQKIEANSSGGPHRDHSAFIVLELNKVTFEKEIFDKTAPHSSTTVFQIDDIVIKDCVKASEINEMLYQYSVSLEPKRSSTPLFFVRISENKASGGNMRVSMQPIKVNMDQDTLEFLSDFIDETSRLLKLKKNLNSSNQLPTISVPSNKNTDGTANGTSLIKQNMLLRSSMMESVHPSRKEEHSFDVNGQIEDYDNFLNDIDDDDEFVKQRAGKDIGDKENEENEIVSDDQTFFKHFVFSPSIKVYVDYFGKRKMNMEKNGSLMGIIMAFGQLNRMPITLRKINTRIGLLGFESCLSHAVNEWTKEMVKHIPSYIESIGPIRPLVQIGKGVRDLCQMPLSELNKSDGSLLKGLQKGVGAFGVSSAASVIGMAQTVTGCVQSLAEMALQENLPDVSSKRKTSGYYNETIPSDVKHSLQLAYELLQDKYHGTSADQKPTAPKKRAVQKSAVQNAFEYAVPAILGPIALASQVTNQILGGMKNQLRPDSYHDKNRKYGGKKGPGREQQ